MDMIWKYISTEKHQILVKVEEDPNRQKIFAAMAAAAAATNQPITPVGLTPSGSNIPSIYQQQMHRNTPDPDNTENIHRMDI